MNTNQLTRILEEDPYVGPLFHGVYAINRLPRVKNGAYVINTAPDTHPGLHWVAVLVKGDIVEYFDSYGGEPQTKLQQWTKRKQWSSNPIPLQSPLSSVCGQYCIYFLLHRTRGIDLASLLMDFGSDVDDNDRIVYDFVEDRYDLHHLKLIDTARLISQLSSARTSYPSIRKIMSGQ